MKQIIDTCPIFGQLKPNANFIVLWYVRAGSCIKRESVCKASTKLPLQRLCDRQSSASWDGINIQIFRSILNRPLKR